MIHLERDNLVVFYYHATSEIWPDKVGAFGGWSFVRGIAFDGSGPIKVFVIGGWGFIRGMAFDGSGMITSGCHWWVGLYKRDGL